MQAEPAPPPISHAVLRSYCHATAGILSHVLATTQVPNADELQEAVRRLQNVALRLSESVKLDG